ncbi:MAG: FlgO family outer membrane protein [Desulfovibrionaceae bacterium]
MAMYHFILGKVFIALCILSFLSGDAEATVVSESRKAADVMVSILKDKLGSTSPLLITSLVDESNYTRSNPLAKLITDQVAIVLAQKGFYVLDTKLGKGLTLSREGSAFMLTTELENLLLNEYDAEAVLVGTYFIGEKDIIVSLRVVALGDGKILAGHSYTLNLTPEIELLLVERNTQNSVDTILKQYGRKRLDSVYSTRKAP